MMRRVAFAVGAALCLARCALGCSRPEMPKPEQVCDGAALVSYERELTECIAQGKEAGSYEVYEECASGADVRFRYGHALCHDGGIR